MSISPIKNDPSHHIRLEIESVVAPGVKAFLVEKQPSTIKDLGENKKLLIECSYFLKQRELKPLIADSSGLLKEIAQIILNYLELGFDIDLSSSIWQTAPCPAFRQLCHKTPSPFIDPASISAEENSSVTETPWPRIKIRVRGYFSYFEGGITVRQEPHPPSAPPLSDLATVGGAYSGTVVQRNDGLLAPKLNTSTTLPNSFQHASCRWPYLSIDNEPTPTDDEDKPAPKAVFQAGRITPHFCIPFERTNTNWIFPGEMGLTIFCLIDQEWCVSSSTPEEELRKAIDAYGNPTLSQTILQEKSFSTAQQALEKLQFFISTYQKAMTEMFESLSQYKGTRIIVL